MYCSALPTSYNGMFFTVCVYDIKDDFKGYRICREPCSYLNTINSFLFTDARFCRIISTNKEKSDTSGSQSPHHWHSQALTNIWSRSSCAHCADTHSSSNRHADHWLEENPTTQCVWGRTIPKILQTNIWCQTSPPSEGPWHQPPRQTVVIGLQIQDQDVLNNNKSNNNWSHRVHVAMSKQGNTSLKPFHFKEKDEQHKVEQEVQTSRIVIKKWGNLSLCVLQKMNSSTSFWFKTRTDVKSTIKFTWQPT